MAEASAPQYELERRSEARRQADAFALLARDNSLVPLLQSLPVAMCILDPDNHIVYANPAAKSMESRNLIPRRGGPRLGEFLGCARSREGCGCGTTPSCQYCGARKAITQDPPGTEATEECHLLLGEQEARRALDLRIWCRPLRIQEAQYTFLLFMDIEAEKRRLYLEQVFLHDLGNTTHTLKGFIDLLEARRREPSAQARCLHTLRLLSDQILDEIQAQKLLLAAEQGELITVPAHVNALALALEMLGVFGRNDRIDGRQLRLDPGSRDAPFRNDPSILKRVLGNMLRNAIEASVPGETVLLGCAPFGDDVRFWVQNPTYMPENVRLQVFQRSFSTKGAGRGLGTYSMKLLTEQYLGGRIGFTSSEAAGTRFTVSLPGLGA